MSATKDNKHDKPATQQIIFFYISLELQTSQSLFNFVKKKKLPLFIILVEKHRNSM